MRVNELHMKSEPPQVTSSCFNCYSGPRCTDVW